MTAKKVTPVSAMLKRAESWQQAGDIHQAIDVYFKLAENFPGTDEASKAEEGLLNLAQELEEKGMVYAAMRIYEKLAPQPVGAGVRRILSPMARRV